MQRDFSSAYKALNHGQKTAVDKTEGPVLVIAGPGTGKTQLLTLRVANILATTDTLPSNILCLTFTDSAATTMRNRLSSIIGKAAYDVTISTYHAFGSDLLRRYPQYFTDSADLEAADELKIDTILRDILNKLPYSNPLKHEVFINDVKQFISDAKRALLTPQALEKIITDNQTFVAKASLQVKHVLQSLVRIDKRSLDLFTGLATATEPLASSRADNDIWPLSQLWQADLEQAIELAAETGKTNPLTVWKNTWLAKDAEGNWIADGREQNLRLQAATEIYKRYLKSLEKHGLFDYDDMILRAINGLESNPDLRFTLQERYLYILLDEYQDTNGAQAHLIELLTDNPVNEGRPNIMAVGDDDQAIYAFQGANYSHMQQFTERYRDVLVVPLIENYRSHNDILTTSMGISDQIQTRLHQQFPQINKTLTQANKNLPANAVIQRHGFKSQLGQNTWIASSIMRLVSDGNSPHDIAVLAPKHEHLESLVPFLQRANLSLYYEKRENILDDPAINELITMSQLTKALGDRNKPLINALWARVLSYDFWEIPTSLLWEFSWQANDTKNDWTSLLLAHDRTQSIALFFLHLSQLAGGQTLEQTLDAIIGVMPLALHEQDIKSYRSPFYSYYFGLEDSEPKNPQAFWQLLSNLTVLRERLRNYKNDSGTTLTLMDFLELTTAYRAANIKIINTNPYQESTDAVELLTAYKAKGREFKVVFVLAAIDEVWGSKVRSMSSRLSLPANLQFIRYAGASEDERLRLFYVALTRAKQELYLTSYSNTYSGKLTTPLKYLDERTHDDGAVVSPLLPAANRTVSIEDIDPPETEALIINWQQRHYTAIKQPKLRELLQERLDRYQLSPTQYNTFLNVRSAGPQSFLMQALLRFPSAPSDSAEFGNAIHETLEWVHHQTVTQGVSPAIDACLKTFKRLLTNKQLTTNELALLIERGANALTAYLKQRSSVFKEGNYAEYSFRSEGAFIGEAHLTGKIDYLIIDRTNKTITIVDYKTGKAHSRWEREPKLHFYRYQLYYYKLLVEHSTMFRGYTVVDAYLDFVEPDIHGKLQQLHITFDEQTSERVKNLVQCVWQKVQDLDFPEITKYSTDLSGIEAFEDDLLTGAI